MAEASLTAGPLRSGAQENKDSLMSITGEAAQLLLNILLVHFHS